MLLQKNNLNQIKQHFKMMQTSYIGKLNYLIYNIAFALNANNHKYA
jgi:hypothetical protein